MTPGAAATVTGDGGTAHSADEPLLDHQDEPLSVTVMRKASVLPLSLSLSLTPTPTLTLTLTPTPTLTLTLTLTLTAYQAI